jgi:hypothetical protein
MKLCRGRLYCAALFSHHSLEHLAVVIAGGGRTVRGEGSWIPFPYLICWRKL